MGRSVATHPEASFTQVINATHVDGPHEFEEAVSEVCRALTKAFGSLHDDRASMNRFQSRDIWVTDECRLILSNRLAQITVSEYCGVAAFCLVPRRRHHPVMGELAETNPLAENWACKVGDRFRSIVREAAGGGLRVKGHMSNGVAVMAAEG